MSHSSDKGLQLIADEEGCPLHPYWPPASITSGVTLGLGDDLGGETEATFRADWGAALAAAGVPPADVNRLAGACGVRGMGAGQLAAQLHDITIPRQASAAVFRVRLLPQYEAELIACMPGADTLPGDVFGALTDLVYNRGNSLAGDRRLEMRVIASAVKAFAGTTFAPHRHSCLVVIADQLTHMGDRLWPASADGQTTPDWNHILRDRRYAEAALVRATAEVMNPNPGP